MSIAERAAAYYDEVAPAMSQLQSTVERELRGGLDDRDLAIHSVLSRVKERESFVRKMAIRGYTDPAAQIQDLVGARVVCLYLSDLAAVGEIIDSRFRVLERDDKIATAPANSFGYMSVHYTCALRDAPELEDFVFEIQVRTLLMDAWANVSHHLAYKGEASVPGALRRDFHALAGLFFVADRQFSSLADAAWAEQEEAVARIIAADETGESVDLPLNRATLSAYLRLRLPGVAPGDAEDVSELVEDLTAAGYSSLGEVEAQVDAALEHPQRVADEPSAADALREVLAAVSPRLEPVGD